MGCLCSKGISANEFVDNHIGDKGLNKHQCAISSKREEFRGKGNEIGRGASARLITHDKAEENTGSTPILWDGGKKASVGGKIVHTAAKTDHFGTNDVARKRQLPKISNIPDGVEGAQVAAGWPSWLSAVAGEAIEGWIPRKADSFEKLYKIGQGTYSSVYRGRDLETGKIVAMKKVRFINMDPESVRFMAREIIILRRLNHPNVMKLDGLVTSRISGSLYLIFEYMDHDLAGLVATTGIQFTEAQIKCYMKQLLHGLEHCHSRGVLHRDIKGSNLLLDNNGNLKIGDFGLSTFSNPSQQKQPLTSRVVTLWYRPPELLLGSTDYGAEVDLWSSGCILAELFCGKPIMPGRTEVEQLHKIFKICGSPSEEYWRKAKLRHATIFKPQNPYPRRVNETFKDLSSPALTLLDVLLAVEPDKRGSASSALQSQFFRTLPFPCDPATLPKYPPCKEFDLKLREDEARRKRAAGGKVRDAESSKRGLEEGKAVPAPDANAELHNSMQRWHGKTNPKSISEKFGPRQEDDVLDFGTANSRKGTVQRDQCTRARLSNSAAARSGSRHESSSFNGEKGGLQQEQPSRRHEWLHRLVDGSSSGHKMGLQGGTPAKSIKGHVSRRNDRVHYSGPLMPPGGNLEEMLKDHERQIQNAVRRAQQGKAKSKPHSGHRPAEHLVVGVIGA